MPNTRSSTRRPRRSTRKEVNYCEDKIVDLYPDGPSLNYKPFVDASELAPDQEGICKVFLPIRDEDGDIVVPVYLQRNENGILKNYKDDWYLTYAIKTLKGDILNGFPNYFDWVIQFGNNDQFPQQHWFDICRASKSIPSEYPEFPIGTLVYIQNEQEMVEHRYAQIVSYEKEPIFTVFHQSHPIIEVRNINPALVKRKYFTKKELANPRGWVTKEMIERIAIPEGRKPKDILNAMNAVGRHYWRTKYEESKKRTIKRTIRVKHILLCF